MPKNKKIIGILGGMGPEATADLYLRIIKLCQEKYKAKYDEDYPQIIINSINPPDVVSSGEFWCTKKLIRKMKTEVLPTLTRGIKVLETAGADFIIIACNTVQYFIPELRKSTNVPIVSIPEEVRKILINNEIKKVGLLATTTTIKMKIYEDELKTFKIKIIKPFRNQQKRINQIILNLMKGKREERDKKFLESVINDLVRRSAEAIILGCTELPLIIRDENCKVLLIDTTQIMADVAVEMVFDR